MDSKTGLYTIGQMAKLCNVSDKQLRHYDQNGIISPAFKDSANNYRYYTKSQMYEILLLKELRNMNMSLKDIGEVLKNRDMKYLRKKLSDQMIIARAGLKEALQRYDQMVDMYMRVSDTMEILASTYQDQGRDPDCQIIQIAPRWLVYARYVSEWNVHQLFTERRAEVTQIADRYGLVAKSAIGAVFHGGYLGQFSDAEEDRQGDFEVCMEVEDPKDCPHCRKTEAFTALQTVHIGPYPELIDTYVKMRKWADSHGVTLKDVSIEEYLCGPSMTEDASAYVTRVYIPVV